MNRPIERRDFLKLAALGGGVVFASALTFGREPGGISGGAPDKDFHFVQLSDTHWGFDDPAINPDSHGTLAKAIQAVNELPVQPDFVVFTGDLIHTTADPKERRRRMAEFKKIVSGLKVKTVRFLPGEHDASLDQGEAYREFFGETHYVFDHKGIHFIVLDNVSDITGSVGDTQFEWLRADLGKRKPTDPIVVLTHRPLFDLYPQWDWATKDGAKVIEALTPFSNVTVFYGHIHQENHTTTGHIVHHSAKSLIFPLPAPGSKPKRMPIPWDADHPYQGLGIRDVTSGGGKGDFRLVEKPVGGR